MPDRLMRQAPTALGAGITEGHRDVKRRSSAVLKGSVPTLSQSTSPRGRRTPITSSRMPRAVAMVTAIGSSSPGTIDPSALIARQRGS